MCPCFFSKLEFWVFNLFFCVDVSFRNWKILGLWQVLPEQYSSHKVISVRLHQDHNQFHKCHSNSLSKGERDGQFFHQQILESATNVCDPVSWSNFLATTEQILTSTRHAWWKCPSEVLSDLELKVSRSQVCSRGKKTSNKGIDMSFSQPFWRVWKGHSSCRLSSIHEAINNKVLKKRVVFEGFQQIWNLRVPCQFRDLMEEEEEIGRKINIQEKE